MLYQLRHVNTAKLSVYWAVIGGFFMCYCLPGVEAPSWLVGHSKPGSCNSSAFLSLAWVCLDHGYGQQDDEHEDV